MDLIRISGFSLSARFVTPNRGCQGSAPIDREAESGHISSFNVQRTVGLIAHGAQPAAHRQRLYHRYVGYGHGKLGQNLLSRPCKPRPRRLDAAGEKSRGRSQDNSFSGFRSEVLSVNIALSRRRSFRPRHIPPEGYTRGNIQSLSILPLATVRIEGRCIAM
jgi:hypothetical protein